MTIDIERLPLVDNPESDLEILEHHQTESGLSVDYVSVSDGYEGRKFKFQRASTQAILNSHEMYLRDNPSITVESPFNPARDYLNGIPAVFSWKGMMPSAMALYPLQRPEETYLPNGTKVDKLTRQLFRHGLDAIGIRSRAKIMEAISLNQVSSNEGETIEWISLACGSAVPALDAIGNIKSKLPDKDLNLTLADWDDQALHFAKALAEHQGLEEGQDFTVKNQDLIRGLVLSDRLVEDHGKEVYDMVDMMGIFEYFDEKRAPRLLENAYQLLKPGGSLVVGNMLKTHPNLRLNQAAVGWPGVKPRSLDELTKVITDAGIDIADCQAYVPEDGVYAVVEIGKKNLDDSSVPQQRQLGKIALVR